MRRRRVKYQVPTWQTRTVNFRLIGPTPAPATGRRMNAGDGHCPQDRTYGPFGDEAARVRMRIRTRIVIAPAGLRSGATNRLLTSCSRRSRKARMTTPASPPAHRHRSRAPPCAAKQSIGRSARPGAARS
jgi:hypothetical protein